MLLILWLCVWGGEAQAEDDCVYPARYLENYDGSFDFNSTACRELRQEIMDVKVLTMWVFMYDTAMTHVVVVVVDSLV